MTQLSLCCACYGCGPCDGDDGNVVFLAEVLCGFDDRGGGLCGDIARTFEAEQFAVGPLSLDHSIGVEDQAAADVETHIDLFIHGVRGHAKRKGTGELHFPAVEIRRQMAGVAQGDVAVGREVCSDGSREPATRTTDE